MQAFCPLWSRVPLLSRSDKTPLSSQACVFTPTENSGKVELWKRAPLTEGSVLAQTLEIDKIKGGGMEHIRGEGDDQKAEGWREKAEDEGSKEKWGREEITEKRKRKNDLEKSEEK